MITTAATSTSSSVPADPLPCVHPMRLEESMANGGRITVQRQPNSKDTVATTATSSDTITKKVPSSSSSSSPSLFTMMRMTALYEDQPHDEDTEETTMSVPSSEPSSSTTTTVFPRSLSNDGFVTSYRMVQDRFMTALHEEAWDIVEVLCEDYPSLAKDPITMVFQGENSTCLALHYASSVKSTPVSTIDALVAAHPSSLQAKESTAKRLALHMAVLKGQASFAVVRYLVEAMPSSLAVEDEEGNLPLHYAAMNGGTNAVVQLLVQAYPKACSTPNQPSQRLPLHLLCARCWDTCCCRRPSLSQEEAEDSVISIKTINQVIDTYPHALQVPDRRGRLPLHVCCSSHPRADILQVLVERYPQALLVASDQSKWTPFELARMFSSSSTTTHHHGTPTTATTSNNTADKKCYNNTSNTSDVVLAFLSEATNREQRKKYKFLAPFKQVGNKLARRRRQQQVVKSNAELYYCYG